MTVGSLLFKLKKISFLEAYVEKLFKKFFFNDVSIWKLKWRKINLNLNFLNFVISAQKIFNSVFSMEINLNAKTNQIGW